MKKNHQVQENCMIQDQHTKTTVLLYASNEQSENKTKKTIPFTIVSKKNERARNKFNKNSVKTYTMETTKYC